MFLRSDRPLSYFVGGSATNTMASPLATTVSPSRIASLATDSCVFCRLQCISRPVVKVRRIHSSTRRPQQKTPSSSPSSSSSNKSSQTTVTPSVSKTSAPTSQAPSSRPGATRIPRVGNRPHIRARDGELVPAPLTLPLGLPYPPQPGQNTGVDTRSLTQRRDDFVSYDKHLERRHTLIKDLYEKNYFRDLGNVGRVHKGKSMLAPTTPFRKEVALWFPNFRGGTAVQGAEGRAKDTTDVLRGRVSVVKIISTDWADKQAESFVGKTENEGLWKFMEGEGNGVAQLVEINCEPNYLKYWLVKMFMGRLRKLKPPEQWGRYFLVNKGMGDDVKEALGIWNSMVGYVYLLDKDCKVRWAGNGDAREDEKKSLVNCLNRLVDEAKGVARPKIIRRADPTPASLISPGRDAEVSPTKGDLAAGTT